MSQPGRVAEAIHCARSESDEAVSGRAPDDIQAAWPGRHMVSEIITGAGAALAKWRPSRARCGSLRILRGSQSNEADSRQPPNGCAGRHSHANDWLSRKAAA